MSQTLQHGYLTAASLNLQNHICVLPVGSLCEKKPRDWTSDSLKPYLSYCPDGQPKDRMFGGLIFQGISARKKRYLYPMYVGFGQPGDKRDWTEWIDRLFASKRNLEAAILAASRFTPNPLDIWVSIPYPHRFQRNFGRIGKKDLNFESQEDRFTAVHWWIERFLERWQSASRLHGMLRFRGFLWLREAIDGQDEQLVKQVNEHIKTVGLYSMWLSHYGSYGYAKCNELGFNVTAVNSNYYGKTACKRVWLENACMFASACNTGLQITFGRGAVYSDVHFWDYLNLGLEDKYGYMNSSLLVYQFPNHTMQEIVKQRPDEYASLYAFVKETYTRKDYPGISY